MSHEEPVDRRGDRERFWAEHDKDDYECPNCGSGRSEVRRFEVHHIDGHPANGSMDNLIAVCRSCHEAIHDMDPGNRRGHWSERFTNEWEADETPLKYL
jgi:5-methylcytosine-specific restriction endonuclease McrA